ncbi:MAG: hypothetical protein WCI97_01825 [Bacteroidota bacterium]
MKIFSVLIFLLFPYFLFAQKAQSIGLEVNYNYMSRDSQNYFGGGIQYKIALTKYAYFQTGLNYNKYFFHLYEGESYGGKYVYFKDIYLQQFEIPLSIGIKPVFTENQFFNPYLGFSIIPNLRWSNPEILPIPNADTLVNPTLNFLGSIDIGLILNLNDHESFSINFSYIEFPNFTYVQSFLVGGLRFGIGYSFRIDFKNQKNSP